MSWKKYIQLSLPNIQHYCIVCLIHSLWLALYANNFSLLPLDFSINLFFFLLIHNNYSFRMVKRWGKKPWLSCCFFEASIYWIWIDRFFFFWFDMNDKNMEQTIWKKGQKFKSYIVSVSPINGFNEWQRDWAAFWNMREQKHNNKKKRKKKSQHICVLCVVV